MKTKNNKSLDSKLHTSIVRLEKISAIYKYPVDNAYNNNFTGFSHNEDLQKKQYELMMDMCLKLENQADSCHISEKRTSSFNNINLEPCSDSSLNDTEEMKTDNNESLDSKLNTSFVRLEKICKTVINKYPVDNAYSSLNNTKQIKTANNESLDPKLNCSFVRLHNMSAINKDPVDNMSKIENEDGCKKCFCMYCRKYQSQFARHLRTHKEEKLVKLYFKENKIEKSRIISYIRNRGSGLMEQMYGKMKPVKSTRKGAITEKVQCTMCLGRYSKSTLWKHKHFCYGNNVNKHNI